MRQLCIPITLLFFTICLTLSCKKDKPLNQEAVLTSFSIQGLAVAFEVDQTTRQITNPELLPIGTTLSNRIAEFEFSEGAKVFVDQVVQTSGVSVNDFSSPQKYRILSEDRAVGQQYTVVVQVEGSTGGNPDPDPDPDPSTDSQISAFSLFGIDAVFEIDQTACTITNTGELPFGTDVSAAIAVFTFSENATVAVNGIDQESGTTPNDFTDVVAYTVTAEDGSTSKDYAVTVNVNMVDPNAAEWNSVTMDAGFLAFDYQRAAFFDGEIYVMGTAVAQLGELNFQQVWRSTDGITWSQVSTTPLVFPEYTGFELLNFNNTLQNIGGLSLLDFPGGVFTAAAQNSSSITSNGDNWLKNDNLDFSARAFPRGAVFNGEIYIVGGNQLAFGTPNVSLSDVWKSSNGIDWTMATDNPGWDARSIPAVFVHDGKLWVTGGGGLTVPGPEPVQNDVWFTEDGTNWTQVAVTNPYPARTGHSAISYKGKMYVLFGEDGALDLADKTFYNDIWVSEDNGVTWSEVTGGGAAPIDFEVRGHASVLVDALEQVWVIGGINTNGALKDVWKGQL